MEFELRGHRALVTGSGRGIGSAIALELARGGADVVVHYSADRNSAEKVAAEIQSMGRESCVVQADLCKLAEAKALMEKVGNVDILVLNASVQIKKPWEEITLEDCEKQVNCNYLSSLLLIQQAVPYMRRQGWGRIITIGSVQEKKPHPQMLIYSSTKCAQTGLMYSLAGQLAQDGITVNNVAPGVIATDRNAEALRDETYAKQVTGSIPMGFYGEKEDCAGIVRLLCSQAGRYITGESIYVDGGKHI